MTPEEMANHLLATVQTLTTRVEVMLKLLEQERQEQKGQRDEMDATMKLCQQYVAKADEAAEHQATITQTLTVLETRLRDSLTTLVSLNRSKAQQQQQQGGQSGQA